MAVSAIHASNEEMPIIGYYGIPETHLTDEAYRVFHECGFNVNEFGYSSLEKVTKACQLANKYGIKVLAACPEMYRNPQMTAAQLIDELGFMGYSLQDEPSVSEMQNTQLLIEKIKTMDNRHLFYINLLPYYNKRILERTKTSTYEEYLKAAVSTSCQQISFDYYPITKDSIRSTWYYNLEMVRKASIASRKPFWGFVLSVPHINYPQPTMGSLRLQVYSNLAYGAQAIQYFTYWTPTNDPKYYFYDAPISGNGKKTKTYSLVQRMNRELKSVAKLFYGAKILSVHHLGTVPYGTSRLDTMPINLSSFAIVGHPGAIISQFTQKGHYYLAVINKSYEKSLKLRIRSKNNIPRHLTKLLKEQEMKSSYTITAGDILLFRLK